MGKVNTPVPKVWLAKCFCYLNRIMKIFVFFAVIFALCHGNPVPGPEPKPVASPEPKPNPGLLLSSSPTFVTSPVVTYSHYVKSPIYHAYQPYVYNLGYASGYSYNGYPYYVPVHII